MENEPKSSRSQFVFLVCQQGTENSLKTAFLANGQAYRLAFSRPGVLTFKLSEDSQVAQSVQSPLIRISGEGLGNVRGELAESLVDEALLLAKNELDVVHVFQRDRGLPGQRGFEPGLNQLCEAVGHLLAARCQRSDLLVNRVCPLGSRVLDMLIIEPNHWLIGRHVANQLHECWPGGVFPVARPSQMVSRAYLKMAEAVAWSGFDFQPNDRIVEIGCAPGGSCQRLLDMGLHVVGVDPAEMDELLTEHERFEHWRTKAAGVKRKMFSKFRWLAADANVAPNYTLAMIEDIVTYPTSRFQGLLLTIKLSSYDLLTEAAVWRERIQGWGFPHVKLRQLSYNRSEVCVAASR